MQHLEFAQFLGLLFVLLGAAKVFGQLAQWIGQPAVLGELVAGVIIGKSVLGLIDPKVEVFHLMGELGVLILLFSIGLETDLGSLLRAGAASTVVAVAGVVLPFAMGYALSIALGLPNMVAIVVGAALTATSVGITARVLSDMGRLQDKEGQVILGAAILDDVIGLVILTVIAGMANGQEVTGLFVAKTTAVAFGFLAVTVMIGRVIVPRLTDLLEQVDLPGTPTILALMLAFGLGWLADLMGSAVILGAFAAGILMVGTHAYHDIEAGMTRLGHFFVPIFFIMVGASVDVTVLNPWSPGGVETLALASALSAVAIIGKFLSGYAAFWFKGRKSLIGAGMIPRGEVGLIFAQMGFTSGVLDDGQFAAVTVVMMVTTFVAPPLLRYLAPPRQGNPFVERDHEGIEDLATEA